MLWASSSLRHVSIVLAAVYGAAVMLAPALLLTTTFPSLHVVHGRSAAAGFVATSKRNTYNHLTRSIQHIVEDNASYGRRRRCFLTIHPATLFRHGNAKNHCRHRLGENSHMVLRQQQQQRPLLRPPLKVGGDQQSSPAAMAMLDNATNSRQYARRRRRTIVLRAASKKIILALATTLLVVFQAMALPALASSTSSGSPALLDTSGSFFTKLMPIRRRPKRKHVVWGIASMVLLWNLVDVVTTRRRQAVDATSEWGRYARHPMARGRAIASLLMLQLAPLLLFSRLLGRKTNERWSNAAANVFSDGLLKLGPLYIKLGQILSCRENLFPESWKRSMERLQDQVPAQTGRKAQQLAYAAWPGGQASFDATFENVNWTPLAAASLGQVHTATYQGEEVALKLQRAYLQEIYDKDFATLTRVASIVDRYFGSTAGSVGGVQQSWTEIFEDAEEILYREIDYRAEAENAMRFCRDFGLTKGGEATTTDIAKSRDGKDLPSAAPWLRTPYVYDQLSTEKVLVMECVKSIKVTSSNKLTAANVTSDDRVYLADLLGRSYLRQFCCNKFFSTDPHAGNLGVEILNMNSSVPAERVRLVYYDFGQAAELKDNQAEGILEIIEAIVDMDVDRSVASFQKMGVLKEGADLNAVRAKVADNYRTGKVKANRVRLKKRGYKFKEAVSSNATTKGAVNSAGNATTASNTTSRADEQVMKYFTLPAEYAFVGRALSQMDGCGKSLDPDFDFVSSAAPWIFEIKGAGKYLKEELLKKLTNFRNEICQRLGLHQLSIRLAAGSQNGDVDREELGSGEGMSTETSAATLVER